MQNDIFCINCTVVELKRNFARQMIGRQKVLIVPLWNWNIIAYYDIFKNYYVLIVPLWNWNLTQYYEFYGYTPVLIVPLWNWNHFLIVQMWLFSGINCTVVELKQVTYVKTGSIRKY